MFKFTQQFIRPPKMNIPGPRGMQGERGQRGERGQTGPPGEGAEELKKDMEQWNRKIKELEERQEKRIKELEERQEQYLKRIATLECAPPPVTGGPEFQEAFTESFGTTYDPGKEANPILLSNVDQV